MTTKTYSGSCHCRAVRFEADIDLSVGSGKCNCSICRKARNWAAMIKPEAFRLLAGEQALSNYTFGSGIMHHLFCKHCGVRPFGRGTLKELGGAYYSVALACLDDVDARALAEVPLTYFDGLNNNWWQPPAETRHL
jgi:hypothetical protein